MESIVENIMIIVGVYTVLTTLWVRIRFKTYRVTSIHKRLIPLSISCWYVPKIVKGEEKIRKARTSTAWGSLIGLLALVIIGVSLVAPEEQAQTVWFAPYIRAHPRIFVLAPYIFNIYFVLPILHSVVWAYKVSQKLKGSIISGCVKILLTKEERTQIALGTHAPDRDEDEDEDNEYIMI